MFKKILKDLVGISSIYPNELEIAGYIVNYLKNSPGKVRKQMAAEGRCNILYEIGNGPALLLLGHMDTIPLKDGWNTNPYILTIKGDKMYGLGAWDMKAGLSAILDTLVNFKPTNFKLKVAFVCDEENYSVGAEKLIQSGWLKDVIGCISIEPGFIHGDKGMCLGRIGRCVFDVQIKTKGGHTYLARDGDNAINSARLFLNAISNLKPMVHSKLGSSNIFPRSIYSEASAMSIPDALSMQIEVNTVPPQTTESVLNEWKLLIQKENLKGITIKPAIRPTPFCQPFVVDSNNKFVKTLTSIYQKEFNKTPIYYYRNSVADDNRIAFLGIPTITVGPKGGNAHRANEWVSYKSTEKIIKFLKATLLSYNTY